MEMAQNQVREKGKTKGRNEGVGKVEVGKGESGVTCSYVMEIEAACPEGRYFPGTCRPASKRIDVETTLYS